MSKMTATVNALLIGGPNDGERLTIGSYETQIIMQNIKNRISISSYEADVDVYQKTNFHMQDKGKLGEFSLFTHSSIPNNSIAAVQILIEGYRNPRGIKVSFSHDVESLENYPPKRIGL